MRRQLEADQEAGNRIGSNRLQLLVWRTESGLLQVEQMLERLETRYADDWSTLEAD